MSHVDWEPPRAVQHGNVPYPEMIPVTQEADVQMGERYSRTRPGPVIARSIATRQSPSVTN